MGSARLCMCRAELACAALDDDSDNDSDGYQSDCSGGFDNEGRAARVDEWLQEGLAAAAVLAPTPAAADHTSTENVDRPPSPGTLLDIFEEEEKERLAKLQARCELAKKRPRQSI